MDGASAGGTCQMALFCDDFESYVAGAAPAGGWRAGMSNGTVRVDTVRAFSGTKAARFQMTAGMPAYRRAFMARAGAPIFPLPGNVMHGRMMVWLDQAPVGGVHWTNIQGEGPVAGQMFRALYRYGGMYQKLMANYETSGVKTDCWKNSQTLMPEKRWACLQWRFAGATNQLDFWLDGKAVNDLTVVQKGSGCIAHDTQDNWFAPTFDTLQLGWEHYQEAATPIDLSIDDVAIGTAAIACP